uniref:Uncharacterized protein n=1 Tax=Populus trichocarpa TaxID=3694 RepID=A9P859_POPTR|nr:unknown [Populus trichocarpa]
MSWHCTCQSLKDLDTRVGNTCLSTVLLSLHLNGTHFLLLQPLEMTTSVFTLELSVIGQGSFEQCSQRYVSHLLMGRVDFSDLIASKDTTQICQES